MNKIVFVVPDKLRLSGSVDNIIEYGTQEGWGLPRIFSDILCEKRKTTFIVSGPDNYNVVPRHILDIITDGCVYLYDCDYEGDYVLGSQDNIHVNDILIFPSEKLTVGNLRSISATSNFYDVTVYILKKMNIPVYVPKNRVDENCVSERKYRVSYDDRIEVPVPTSNDIFKCRLASGIGDILLSKALLDYTRDTYSKVIITPYFPPIREYKTDSDSYIKFVYKLYDMLFKPPFYEIVNDQSFPFVPDGLLFKELGMPGGFKPNLEHLICDDETIPGEYYTVLTKVRDIDYLYYRDVMKKEIMAAFKRLSKKKTLVLLGERELIQSKEYKEAKIDTSTFSIYKDIIKNVPNIIDMTFPFSSEDRTPSIESIQQTCTYMRDAVCNFSIGRGGLLVMALSVGNVVYLTSSIKGAPHFIFEKYWYDTPIKGIHVSPNYKDFIKQIDTYAKYKKPSKYSTSLHLGIGDVLFARAMLDKTDFKEIIIRPRLSLLSQFNKSLEYGEHVIKMFKEFFSEPPYKLILNYEEDIPGRPRLMYKNDRILPAKPYFPEILCKKIDIPKDPYIILHTKVKGIPKFEYEKFKTNFFDALNKLGLKVMLLGGRSINGSSEWEVLKKTQSIYTIYDDCKKYLKNCIDMTEDIDFIEKPRGMYKSCYKMKMARATITFGVGGNFSLASATAGYHIGLIVHHPYYDKIYEKQIVNNGFVTKDHKLFIEKIKNIARDNISQKPVEWFLKDGEYSFSTSGSIGEMILSVYLLENDPRVEKVNMSFWNGFLYAYQDQDVEIRRFFKDFATLLTKDCKKPFNITDQQYEYTAVDSMCVSQGFVPEHTMNFPQLGSAKSPIKNPYIVILSKMRSIETSEFDSIKKEYFSHLKFLSKKYKIVLIGERSRFATVGGPKMNICIYHDTIKSGVKIDDRTVKIDRAPNLDTLLPDISYIKHAKAVITIGNGGQYCIGLATNANLFSYMGYDRKIYHTGQSSLFWKQDWCLKHTYFNNFDKFWNDIYKYLKIKRK